MKMKKKGRPSKNLLPFSIPPEPAILNSMSRRSTRRNPSNSNSTPQPEFGEEDDDEDERKEKKVKLVVRLPQSDDGSPIGERNRRQRDSRHSQDSDSGSEHGEGPTKKRRIDGVDCGSEDGAVDQDKEVVKGTDTLPNGSPLDLGPTAPLPDKKLLVFILDRLQKKDTYGVFAEPVDPDELPDYFEIIEHPMDFETVRKKLDNGTYKNLEELEADVFLICSNAMQYNASDTVYFRQARAIEGLAKRDFENLRHEGDDGKPQPKVVRRGRPPGNKNQRKFVETSPLDCVESVGTEVSSGASLANGEEKTTGTSSYNLRKSTGLFRIRTSDSFVSPCHSRNGENHSEWLADWNDEFPASVLRADMKHTKRQFTVDENRRNTYRQSLSSGNTLPAFSNSMGNMKRLVPVGFQEALAYATSLARYAATLGPIASKMASKKIEAILPAGIEYGQGWVGDNEAPSWPFSYSAEKPKSSNSTANECNSSRRTPSTSDLGSVVGHESSKGAVGAARQINNRNELAGCGVQLPAQQNMVHLHPYGNGSSITSPAGGSMMGHSVIVSGVSVPQTMETVLRSQMSSRDTSVMNPVLPGQEPFKLPETWNNFLPGYQITQAEASGEAEAKTRQSPSMQQRHPTLVPPDLNVRVPAGSASSSLLIGSPRQPDVTLQL